MKKTAVLLRNVTGEHGTFGNLYTLGFKCKVLEPPWKDNRQNVSCIPKGTYECFWYQSSKFGGVYLLRDVSGRSGILTHSGNFGGDIEKDLISHTLGCLLLGKENAYFGNVKQKGITLSRVTCRRFFNHMNKKSFTLHVVNCF